MVDGFIDPLVDFMMSIPTQKSPGNARGLYVLSGKPSINFEACRQVRHKPSALNLLDADRI